MMKIPHSSLLDVCEIRVLEHWVEAIKSAADPFNYVPTFGKRPLSAHKELKETVLFPLK